MSVQHLLTFVAVAEAANISRAADRLHLSQPAVSAQLRALQDWFGTTLYRRKGQGIELTDAGLALLEQARHVRIAVDEVNVLRDAYAGVAAGTLRLGASTTLASYVLPRIVAAYRQAYPGVALSLCDGNTHEIVERLGTLDLAFIEGEPPAPMPSGAAVQAWGRDEVIAIVPRQHGLARRKSASLQEIAAHPWVTREPGSGLRQLVERRFAQAGFEPVAALELAGVEAVKHAVRAGLGVGFVSSLSMQHEDGSLATVRIGAQGLPRTFSIVVTHAAGPTQAARQFMAMLDQPFDGAGRASH